MSLDEPMRLRIHAKLTELMGSDEADAMMANWLPWRDLATKDDLRVQTAELRAELRSELRGEISGLRTEMHAELGSLRVELERLRTDVHRLVISQTRWILGYITALAAAVVAAGQLI